MVQRASIATEPPPTPGSVSLRPARAEEIGAMLALENELFATDRISARSFREFLRSASTSVVVAERDGAVAGYAIVLFRRNTSVARVYSIAVASNARGQGIGEKLMLALEATARERDALFMRLEVRPDNEPALALYKRLGYRAFGRFLDYYGDHSDAIRFEKSLLSHAPVSARQVRFYAQTTEFTCGPAAMMMALAAAGRPVAFDRRTEIDLWRRSTTIFMATGPGGCEPLGMAVTLAVEGLAPRVYINQQGPLFLDSLRTPWKREIMELVQGEFRGRAARLGIPVHYYPLPLDSLRDALKRGATAIVLISAYRMYHERTPHWLLAYDCDDHYVYAHDPWVDSDSYDVALSKAAVAIPIEQFERMSVYGKSRLRAAVIVENRDRK